ncbi:hypothetical protein [Carboxylicivirga sp. RSCT41]|uniref:hypothetical protein n=1 Tax=Carboxylicivirga agarovorans TaxID=3417570 RepID=UPI003D339D63
MNKDFLKQLPFFKKIKIPKYIEARLQESALKHLELSDMGKLRDRMEGQLYYDRLRCDIFSEYAFEKTIGLSSFNWVQRDKKRYKRKKYLFKGKTLSIVVLNGDSFPRVSATHEINYIFAYVTPEQSVFISGVANNSTIRMLAGENENIIEIKDFSALISYTNLESFVNVLE